MLIFLLIILFFFNSQADLIWINLDLIYLDIFLFCLHLSTNVVENCFVFSCSCVIFFFLCFFTLGLQTREHTSAHPSKTSHRWPACIHHIRLRSDAPSHKQIHSETVLRLHDRVPHQWYNIEIYSINQILWQ